MYTDSREFYHYEDLHNIREKYISKTVALIALQCLFTFLSLFIIGIFEGIQKYILSHYNMVIIIGLAGTILTLYYINNAKKKTIEQLQILTMFEIIILATTTVFFNLDMLLFVITFTLCLCVGLCLYAFASRISYSNNLGRILSTLLSMLLILILCNHVFRLTLLHTMSIYLTLLVFSGYIIHNVKKYFFDFNMSDLYMYDDLHIEAAINIYLNILWIFSSLLNIIHNRYKYK